MPEARASCGLWWHRGGPQGSAIPGPQRPAGPFRPPRPTNGAARGVKFASDAGFQKEVRRRVDEYFRSTGRRQRDCPQMYLKTAILLAFLAASYVLLVFVAQTWWQAVPLAVVLGLAM